MAIKIDTLEYFGPYLSAKECKKDLKLTNPHIGEVLKKQRKSGEGYLFNMIGKPKKVLQMIFLDLLDVKEDKCNVRNSNKWFNPRDWN